MNFLISVLFSLGVVANFMPTQDLETAASTTEMSDELAPEIALHLKSPLVSGNSIKLGYEIPYPGYIEFHLFSMDGDKIWANYGVREKGEHYQAINREKLESGVTYNFEFWYKGKPYPGKFTN